MSCRLLSVILKLFFLTIILLLFKCFVHFLLVPQQYTNGSYISFQTPADLLLYTIKNAGWLYLLASALFHLFIRLVHNSVIQLSFIRRLGIGLFYALACFSLYWVTFTGQTASYLNFALIYMISGLILGTLHYLFFMPEN